MPHFRTVLCGIDFSEHSAQALRCAAVLADHADSSLHVVSVIDPLLPAAAAVAYNVESLRAEILADLRQFLAVTAGERPQVRDATTHMPIGRAAREILRTAETVHADVIVLGTHGLGGVRGLFFGSTTQRLLRDAGLPVLTVPLSDPPDHRPLTHRTPLVVAIDTERESRTQIDAAAALAGDLRSSLVLVHVLRPIQVPQRWRQHADGLDRDRRHTARAKLEALAAIVRDIDVKTIVETGEPSSAIAAVAATEGAQMIVIGLGNPERVTSRPGTTAYRVMCSSQLPVLAVPESEGRSR